MVVNQNPNKPFIQFVTGIGGGCPHLRCLVPGLTMGRREGLNVQPLMTTTPLVDPQILALTAAIVVQQPFGGKPFQPTINQLKALQQKFGFSLIADFDDLSWKIPGVMPNLYGIGGDKYNDEEASKRTEECKEYIGLFDRFTTTNHRLAHAFKMVFGDHHDVRVIPNALNRWGYSRPIRKDALKEKPTLIFTGSSGHSVGKRTVDGKELPADAGDFGSAAWAEFIAHGMERGKFDFMCFGCGIPAPLIGTSAQSRIKMLPGWIPPLEYASFLSRLDIDIFVAPLLKGVFNSCKSNLRALESYINGCPLLASVWDSDDCFCSPYEDIVDDVEKIGQGANEVILWEKYEQIIEEHSRLRQRGYEVLTNRRLIMESESVLSEWMSAWFGGPANAAVLAP